MDIHIKRHWYTETSSSGMIVIDGMTEGFTLEDCARPDGVKIAGKTCIQPGEYPLVVDMSNRFQRLMPHVLNVPFFTGIRIHMGNDALDTEGCILVGAERGYNAIWGSKVAFDRIFDKIKTAFDKGETITLTVTNEPL